MQEYIIKLVRVACYIAISVLIAVLISPELQSYLSAKPELVAYVPLINVVLVAIVNGLKKFAPEDSKIKNIIG
jgi:hypothetical protein